MRPPCTLPLTKCLPFVSAIHFLSLNRFPHFLFYYTLGADVAYLCREGVTIGILLDVPKRLTRMLKLIIIVFYGRRIVILIKRDRKIILFAAQLVKGFI